MIKCKKVHVDCNQLYSTLPGAILTGDIKLNEQEDASNFISGLANFMQRLNPILAPTTYTKQTHECKHCRNTENRIGIGSTHNVKPSQQHDLKAIIESESCDSTEKNCSNLDCNKKGGYYKEKAIFGGKWLTITIQQGTGIRTEKDLTPVEVPQQVVLDSTSYKVIGAIIHIGDTSNKGHYVAITKDTNDDNWLLYDDRKIYKRPNNPFDITYIKQNVVTIFLESTSAAESEHFKDARVQYNIRLSTEQLEREKEKNQNK